MNSKHAKDVLAVCDAAFKDIQRTGKISKPVLKRWNKVRAQVARETKLEQQKIVKLTFAARVLRDLVKGDGKGIDYAAASTAVADIEPFITNGH